MKKGLVSHENKGRTFIYAARLSRNDTAGSFLDRIFDGMASHLVSSLLAAARIPPDELDRIQVLIGHASKPSHRTARSR